MKIKHLISTLLLSASLVTAGITFAHQASVEKAEAASTMVTGTRIYVEDRWTNSGWTGNNKNACLHIYNPSFKAGSGYTSFADIKLNDLYALSFATNGSTYLNVEMKWLSGSYRQYEAILPWYLSGFKYEFYATENSVDRYIYNKNGGAKFEFTAEYGKNISVCFKDGSWGKDATASNYYCNNEYYSDGGYTYEFNGIKSGSHMFLSTQDLTDWEGSNAKFAINFQRSNINKGESWSSEYNSTHTSLSTTFCWKVKGSGNDHLYECIVPQYNGQDVYWSMVIGVRYDPVAASPSWNNKWNQTGDQFYNGDDRDCNMLWVNAASGGSWSGGGYLKTDASISDDTRAGYYGTYFLSKITCDGAGSVDPTSDWSVVQNEYMQHLSNSVRWIIWNSSAAISGTDLQMAMYRYDYIVYHKHYSGYTDFISRDDSEGRAFSRYDFSTLIIDSKKASSTITIIVISVASLAALGGYFFLKKKKEN